MPLLLFLDQELLILVHEINIALTKIAFKAKEVQF